ncbi:hypothetical protein HYU23_00615 [Candidatus Woesearchaeota archaeon]|nr:hypothetical protein [Candidatus Woesearchaeota archaeon]
MYLIAIGEIFLKGKNRINFERKLMKNIRAILNLNPNDLVRFRNRYLLKIEQEPNNLKRVFGVIFYTRVIESKLENIDQAALSLISSEKTFRVSAKKSISLKKDSQKINEEMGAYILSKNSNIKVNLEKPEIEIKIEEISNKFYLYKASDITRCFGGLPVGTAGFVHLIVNDDVNSTVAGFLLMKRGCIISVSQDLPLLHKFESGFNIRIRGEKITDIIATDENFENFNLKQDEKMILRPLLGYTKEQIKKMYEEIVSI